MKRFLTGTMLAAALGLALGLSAVPSGSYACHKDTEHGNQTDCDNGGDGIVYEATLTGAFVFDSVVVTPNTRENVLRSGVDLNFDLLTSGDSSISKRRPVLLRSTFSLWFGVTTTTWALGSSSGSEG